MTVTPTKEMRYDRRCRPAGVRGPFAHLGQGRSGVVIRILRDHTALILLVVLVIAGGTLSDVFLTPRNLLNIMWAVSILGIIALGQTMLLITCNFDMSVAFVVGLAGIITVLAQIAGFDLVTSMALRPRRRHGDRARQRPPRRLHRRQPIPDHPRHGAACLCDSLTLTHSQTLYATIPAFNVLGRGRLFGVIHYSVVLLVVLALVLEFVLRRTTFGRSLYVIGLNETAGRLSGLPIRRMKLITFVLCGGTAALAGLIMTSRTGSTVASAGAGMDFDSIIAAVLGGTSLFGGRRRRVAHVRRRARPRRPQQSPHSPQTCRSKASRSPKDWCSSPSSGPTACSADA